VNYLLDTNAVVQLLRPRSDLVRQHYRQALSDEASIAVSSIVMFELWYGVARSPYRAENAERLRVFRSGPISVIGFEEEDATAAGDLRRALERTGTPIGPYDLLIAAQAVRTGSTLVTANVSEFARVPNLLWQDWAAEP
jgi:tRNA(fMet)-specific endonuclease VapC